MPLLGSPQEVAEEGRPGVPPGNPLPPAVLTMNGGGFGFASVLHLGRIYRTPKMGLLLAKNFAFPVGEGLAPPVFCLKFVQAGAKFVAFCSYIRSHCACGTRERFGFLCHFLGRAKKWHPKPV